MVQTLTSQATSQNFILSIVDPLKFPCEREHD